MFISSWNLPAIETEKALAKEQEKCLYDEERANFEQKILLELALKNVTSHKEKNVQEALHQKEKEFSVPSRIIWLGNTLHLKK